MALNAQQQAFVDLLMPHALEASQRTGVDPRIIVAQAAQETGWGRHAPNNNYFGIKSHGQSGGSNLTTFEYVNGRPVTQQDSFRQYGSPAESVAGYADFLLANSRYRPMMAAQGLDAQLTELGRSGYATDPNYAASVGSIARSISMPSGTQLAYAGSGGGRPAALEAIDRVAAGAGPGKNKGGSTGSIVVGPARGAVIGDRLTSNTRKPPPQAATNSGGMMPNVPTLRIGTGMNGAPSNDVAALQQFLNLRGANIEVDGQFGPQTRAAVEAFQREAGITVDGVVGPQTQQAMTRAVDTMRASIPVPNPARQQQNAPRPDLPPAMTEPLTRDGAIPPAQRIPPPPIPNPGPRAAPVPLPKPSPRDSGGQAYVAEMARRAAQPQAGGLPYAGASQPPPAAVQQSGGQAYVNAMASAAAQRAANIAASQPKPSPAPPYATQRPPPPQAANSGGQAYMAAMAQAAAQRAAPTAQAGPGQSSPYSFQQARNEAGIARDYLTGNGIPVGDRWELGERERMGSVNYDQAKAWDSAGPVNGAKATGLPAWVGGNSAVRPGDPGTPPSPEQARQMAMAAALASNAPAMGFDERYAGPGATTGEPTPTFSMKSASPAVMAQAKTPLPVTASPKPAYSTKTVPPEVLEQMRIAAIMRELERPGGLVA